MLLLAAACAALSACGTIRMDRALSGGALGLGAGALAGPTGAVAGGLIGAGVGAFTPPSLLNLGQPFWRRTGTVTVNTNTPPSTQYQHPNIVFDAYGYGQANYATGTCSVRYDLQGVRTGYYGTCDMNQINTADQDMRAYRARTVPTSSSSSSSSSSSGGLLGAPPSVGTDLNRMRANCESAADQRWGLSRGTSRVSAVRGDDRTGYDIDVAAGFQRGKCTMSLTGEVLRIE